VEAAERRLGRHVRVVADHLEREEVAERRVGLGPRRRILPVAAGVGGLLPREVEVAALAPLVEVPGERRLIEARGRDAHDHRAGAHHAEDHRVPQVAVRLDVDLVEDDEGRVEALLELGVRGQNAVDRVVRPLEVPPLDADDLGQLGLGANHALRLVEHDRRLLAVARAGVDVGGGTEAHQRVDGERRAEGGLAVLPRESDVGVAVDWPARLVEQAMEDVVLPVPQDDRLAALRA